MGGQSALGGMADLCPLKASHAPLFSGVFSNLYESKEVLFIAVKFCLFYAIQSFFFSFLE